MKEYLDKAELLDSIERDVCGWCRHFKSGEYSFPCRTCKVSLVCSEIALATCYDVPDIQEGSK